MEDDQGVPSNVCFVPLGGGKCECGNGDITWYVESVEFNNLDPRIMVDPDSRIMVYTFVENHPEYVINDTKDAWNCLYINVKTWIEFKTKKIQPMFSLKINGKEIKEDAAKMLLQMYKKTLQSAGQRIGHRHPGEKVEKK